MFKGFLIKVEYKVINKDCNIGFYDNKLDILALIFCYFNLM